MLTFGLAFGFSIGVLLGTAAGAWLALRSDNR